MNREDELISQIKEKEDIISDLEDDIQGFKNKIEDLEEKINDLEGELEEWEDHECDCDCSDEIDEAVSEIEFPIPNQSIDDQRKIDLLANNWHGFTFDQLEIFLQSVIKNPLPPRI